MIDSKGNFWVFGDTGSQNSNTPGEAVVEISHAGALLSGSAGYTAGAPTVQSDGSIAIDGTGNVWVSSVWGNYVYELSPAGTLLSGSSGYTAGGAFIPNNNVGPYGIAIDGSGNVWVTNGLVGNVVEMVGAAAPVITPICAGLPSTPTADGSSNLGTRP